MKLLISCTSKSWGGLEQVALRDALILKKMGMDVHVLGIKNSVLMHFCLENKIIFHSTSLGSKYFNFGLIAKLWFLFHTYKYDVVHIHHFNSVFLSLLVFMFKKVLITATRHIYVEHSKKDFFHKWYLNRIDFLFAISDFAKNNLLQMYPLPSDKIKSLYVGIDLNKYKRSDEKAKHFRQEFNIPSNKKLIGIIGRIDNMKGQKEFVVAASLLSKQFNDLHFLIIGKPTSDKYIQYYEDIKTKIKEYNLEKNFSLTGFCKDVSYPLSAMHVFVIPSYFEAFGLSAIEAMSCKVPVVMTNKGSVNEIIPDKNYGIKIEPQNPEMIASAVEHYLFNEEYRIQVINNAYNRTKNIFDQKLYFTKLLGYYNKQVNTSNQV